MECVPTESVPTWTGRSNVTVRKDSSSLHPVIPASVHLTSSHTNLHPITFELVIYKLFNGNRLDLTRFIQCLVDLTNEWI